MIYLNEIFSSISGEVGGIPQGSLTTFVRLQGCNLRCSYCDTPDSQDMAIPGVNNGLYIDEVFNRIMDGALYNVLFTGGEPLLQSDALVKLINILGKNGCFKVQIETNGTLPINLIKNRINYPVSIVMDYKLHSPPSKENIKLLDKNDWMKFVFTSIKQYDNYLPMVHEFSQTLPCKIAVSATNIDMYKDMILGLRMLWSNVVVNVQLHKLINVK